MRKVVAGIALAASLALGTYVAVSPTTFETGANGLRVVQKKANGLANGLK